MRPVRIRDSRKRAELEVLPNLRVSGTAGKAGCEAGGKQEGADEGAGGAVP